MKHLLFSLLTIALVGPTTSFAQSSKNAPAPQQVRKIPAKNQRTGLDTVTRTTVINPIDATTGSSLNSQRETDLKNGGADRTGGQSAK